MNYRLCSSERLFCLIVEELFFPLLSARLYPIEGRGKVAESGKRCLSHHEEPATERFDAIDVTFASLFSKPVWDSALVLLVECDSSTEQTHRQRNSVDDGIRASGSVSKISSGAQSCCMVCFIGKQVAIAAVDCSLCVKGWVSHGH